VLPSDLYQFADDHTNEPVTIEVNGHLVPVKLDQGYAILDRTWKNGDSVDLNLPMPIRRVVANENVKADLGKVALQRGPIVFCAEGVDNPDGKVRNLLLPDTESLAANYEPSLLNGVETLKGRAFSVVQQPDGSLVKTEQDFKAIPYFAWANRGKGEMTVWLANSDHSVEFPKMTAKQ
jgi:DUF1680 family protein